MNKPSYSALLSAFSIFSFGINGLPASVFPPIMDVSSLDGTNGFNILLPAQNAGSVLSGFDFNGDGVDDISISQTTVTSGQGAAGTYIVYGSKSPFPAQLNLLQSPPVNPSPYYSIIPGYAEYQIGSSDINGDGVDDMFLAQAGVGTNYAYPGPLSGANHQSFVFFGGKSPASSITNYNVCIGNNVGTVNLPALPALQVSGVGDVNGDGVADVIMSGYQSAVIAGNSVTIPEVYVLFGGSFWNNAAFSQLAHCPSVTNVGSGVPGMQIVFPAITGLATNPSNFPSWPSVSGAGDVNGDGIDDFIIASPYYNPSGATTKGLPWAYVVFGSKSLPASLDVSKLNGTNGFTITAANAAALTSIYSVPGVSKAGDINGDGVDDVVINQLMLNSIEAPGGLVYVVFGSKESFPAKLDIASLNGSNGFVINGGGSFGSTYADEGTAIYGAGDVNGDGVDDLLMIGVIGGSQTSSVYVLYGSRSGFPAIVSAGSNFNGTQGFIIESIYGQVFGYFGSGDVNGDGLSDILVASSGVVGSMVSIIYGTTAFGPKPTPAPTTIPAFPATLDVSSLDGTNGFTVAAPSLAGLNSREGGLVGVLGGFDFNGDGLDDIAVSRFFGVNNGNSLGYETDIVFGSKLPFSNAIDLSAPILAQNPPYIRLPGYSQLDGRGADFNGDGLDDLYLQSGTAQVTVGTGISGLKSYVVFGENNPTNSITSVCVEDSENINTPNNYVNVVSGPVTSLGGDVNGDGLADAAVSKWKESSAPPLYSAGVYVLFGSKSFWNSATTCVNAADVGSGVPGMQITFSELADLSVENQGQVIVEGPVPVVSGVGDINGDGIDDFVISSPYVPANDAFGLLVSNLPLAYVIFGSRFLPAQLDVSNLNGTNGFMIMANGVAPQGDFVSGSNLGDINEVLSVVAGYAGDLNGDGIDDVMIGAPNAGRGSGLTYDSNGGKVYVVFGSKNAFPAQLNVILLNGTNGFVINGGSFADGTSIFNTSNTSIFGGQISCAGDVNDDGIDDLLIGGAARVEVCSNGCQTVNNNSRAFVLYGCRSGFPAVVEANTAFDGTRGFEIQYSQLAADQTGIVLSSGDINGDGISDIQVGFDVIDVGQTNIVESNNFLLGIIYGQKAVPINICAGITCNNHGTCSNNVCTCTGGWSGSGCTTPPPTPSTGFSPIVDVSSLNGSNGFTISVSTCNTCAIDLPSVLGGFDFNGDGLDDMAYSASFVEPFIGNGGSGNGVGGGSGSTTYVVYGSKNPFPAVVGLDILQVPPENFSSAYTEFTGFAEQQIGSTDINGDGFADLFLALAGPPTSNTEPGVGPTTAQPWLSVILGQSHNPSISQSSSFCVDNNAYAKGTYVVAQGVSGVGDVNGDGIQDAIIQGYHSGGNNIGSDVYVLFGSKSFWNGVSGVPGSCASLSNIGTGVPGVQILLPPGAVSSVSGVGDVNDDGIDDFIIVGLLDIGAGGLPHYAGYVIFGSKSFPTSFNVSSLNGTNGFVLAGLQIKAFNVVSKVGDMNGDGIADFAINAQMNTGANEVYVVFGSKTGFPSLIDLDFLNGSNGFFVLGNVATLSTAISGAGDVNGDGVDDLLISGCPSSSMCGAFVLYGRKGGFSSALVDADTIFDGTQGFELRYSSHAAEYSATALASGDVNGDGVSDMLFAFPTSSVSGPSVSVLYGVPPNPCAGITCNNQGTCSNGVCTCTGGWSGSGCTTAPNPCAGITCNNQGSCSGGVCTCTGGWSGSGCTVAPSGDPCSGITCNGQGTCSNGVCTCTGGWSGSGCTTPPTTGPCAGITCNNQGTCSNGACTCTGGWSGSGCTVPPTTGSCSGITCNSQGTCSNGVCTCTGGWSGSGCTVPPTSTPTPSANQSASATIQANGTQQTAQLSVSVAPNIQDAGQTLNASVNEITVSLQFNAQTSGVSLAAFSETANISSSGLNYTANVVVQPMATSLENAQSQWNNFNGSFTVTITLTGTNSSTRSLPQDFETLANDWLPLSVQYTPNGDGTFTMDILAGGNPFQSVQVAPLNTGGTIASDPVDIQVTSNVSASSSTSSGQNGGTSSSSSGSKIAIIAGGVAGVVGIAAITTTVVLLVKHFQAKAAAAIASAVGSPNAVPNAADINVEMDNIVPGGAPNTPSDGNNNSPRHSQDIRDYRPDLRQVSPRWTSGGPGLDSAGMSIAVVDVNANGSTSGVASPSGQELLAPESMSPVADAASVEVVVVGQTPAGNWVSSDELEQSQQWDTESENPIWARASAQSGEPQQSHEWVLEQSPMQFQGLGPAILPSAPIN